MEYLGRIAERQPSTVCLNNLTSHKNNSEAFKIATCINLNTENEIESLEVLSNFCNLILDTKGKEKGQYINLGSS